MGSEGMAKITWYGHAMFSVEASDGRRLVMDPFSPKIGKEPPSLEAEVVTLSHDHYDHNEWRSVRGTPKVIRDVGRFSLDGIEIKGIPAFHDESQGAKRGRDIIFKISVDKVSIAHMGDYGQEKLSEEQRRELEGIDVLMLPIGGVYTIDAAKALEVIDEIGPKIAIPMHFKIPEVNISIAGVEPFLSKARKVERKPSTVTVEKKDIPSETAVWVMDYE